MAEQAPPVTYARTQLDMPDGGTVALDYEDFDKDLPYGLDRVRNLLKQALSGRRALPSPCSHMLAPIRSCHILAMAPYS